MDIGHEGRIFGPGAITGQEENVFWYKGRRHGGEGKDAITDEEGAIMEENDAITGLKGSVSAQRGASMGGNSAPWAGRATYRFRMGAARDLKGAVSSQWRRILTKHATS